MKPKKVLIKRLLDNKYINASIIKVTNFHILPSITDGWRFNFRKHARMKTRQTYTLVTDEAPGIIQGCLIYDESIPYMAYIEIAPHNRSSSSNQVYDDVAGCLIAHACRLSFLHKDDRFKGWLTFDVLEDSTEEEIKLKSLYKQKYGAVETQGRSTMYIDPENGEKLIQKYLIRKS